MTAIRAIVRAGRVELDVPADWPDGTEVEIHPLQRPNDGDDEAMSPEEIAKTLAAMAQVEPFDLTDAERTAWEDERLAREEREKAEFIGHLEKLRRIWE